MRKLLFAFCLFIAFIGCSDDDEKMGNPIQDLQLPSASETYVSGQSVTIQGKGFTSDSRIWLRAAEDQAQGDVLATIESVNENSITFTVPDNIDGKQQIILKQSGLEYVLGTLSFKKVTEKLYAAIDYNEQDRSTGIGELDIENKKCNMIHKTPKPVDGLVNTKEGKIYYLTQNGSAYLNEVGYFDLTTRQSKTVSTKWHEENGCAIGIINNQLHGIKLNSTKLTLFSMDDNGQQTEIKSWTKPEEVGNFIDDDSRFQYDAKNNLILLAGQNLDNYATLLISLPLADNEVKFSVKPHKEGDSYECYDEPIYIQDQCYLLVFNPETESSTIQKLDPITLTLKENPKTIDAYFTDVFYWNTKNLILGTGHETNTPILRSYNFSTSELKDLWPDCDAYYFITIAL